MPQISVLLVDKDGNTVSYPLTPEEYTLRSLDEVPGPSDKDGYFNEFAVLGKGSVPDLQLTCVPGIGIMDTTNHRWVIGDTFLRRYYSIYDDDRGLVGLVRSIHPDENPPSSTVAKDAPAQAADSGKQEAPLQSAVVTASLPWPLCLQALLEPQFPLRRGVHGYGAGRRTSWTRFL
mmetsp:Transcript_47327/g.85464  ORF Transcript_47327/g.85464 Transcript_47327/m.85464 type:complete len:176 (+) Transcript_47327:51-578(+)